MAGLVFFSIASVLLLENGVQRRLWTSPLYLEAEKPTCAKAQVCSTRIAWPRPPIALVHVKITSVRCTHIAGINFYERKQLRSCFPQADSSNVGTCRCTLINILATVIFHFFWSSPSVSGNFFSLIDEPWRQGLVPLSHLQSYFECYLISYGTLSSISS